jgi:hypothetical protein
MFCQREKLAAEDDDEVRGVAEFGFLLLTCHDEEFCCGMDNVDFFEDGGGVVCQGLFSEMIDDEFETTVGTE